MSKSKKQALVSPISAFMTGAKKEDVIVLDRTLYIYYPVQFQKGDKEVTWALINLGSEVIAITLAYAK